MLQEIKFDGLTCGKAKAKSLFMEIPIHVYLLDDILVDTGSSSVAKDFIKFYQTKKINRVALTHVHEDHSGNAAWLHENFNASIYLHENDIPEASKNSNIPFYRKIIWGNRKAFPAIAMPDFLESKNYKLDVIKTPGHTSNHLAFHEKNKGWLFTGDAYVGIKQKVALTSENISDAIQSIKKMLQLDFDTIFCAHSGINENGKEKLKKKLDYFENIQAQVKTLKEKGVTLKKINKIIFPKKDLWEILSRKEWSSYQIISTIIK